MSVEAPGRAKSPDADSQERLLRVRAMAWEADGVLSLDLADPSGIPLPAWKPGAHIDIELRPGLRRQYSLCGDPDEDQRWKVAILQETASRGGSRFVHTELRPGALLPVAGLRNNFELVDAPEYLFIAGGIGITPLLPMISAVDGRRCPWRLVYGGRRRASMAFLDRLAGFGERVVVRPEDEFGLLDLDDALRPVEPEAVVFCCGPEPLLAAVEQRCTAQGRELHVERFAAKPQVAVGPATSFDVVCRRSGVTTAVASGESVLEAVERAGVPVAYSCQDGICGTCETRVLHGEPEHRDSVLTDQERAAGDTMLICVSRCRSARLVLDL